MLNCFVQDKHFYTFIFIFKCYLKVIVVQNLFYIQYVPFCILDTSTHENNSNRQNKERNKAHAGNHNRRKQSDYKKSRGMMPFPSR